MYHPVKEKMTSIMNVMSEMYFVTSDLKLLARECITFKCEQAMLFGELTMVHYWMNGGESEEIYKAAAAVEMMVLALDIIDDLQDKDQPSILWCKIDPAVAMNVAIGFLMLCIRIVEHTGLPEDRKALIVHCLNTQVIKSINGQHSDLLSSVNCEEEYTEMVRQKSGALVACACMVGVLFATGKADEVVLRYGEHIGIAAQIKNDLHDLLRWDEKSDFLRRKKTALTLYLLHSEEHKLQPVKGYLEGTLTIQKILAGRTVYEQLMRTSGVVEYAKVLMKVHQFHAIELLEQVSISEEWQGRVKNYILFDP